MNRFQTSPPTRRCTLVENTLESRLHLGVVYFGMATRTPEGERTTFSEQYLISDPEWNVLRLTLLQPIRSDNNLLIDNGDLETLLPAVRDLRGSNNNGSSSS
jgi:hypothetical protein